MAMPYSNKGYIYGMLVRKKKRALYEDDNPYNLPLVPDRYVDDVLAYLEYIAEKDEAREKARMENEKEN